MVPNPCVCGCSLQTATRILAIIDIVMATLVGILSMIVLGGLFVILGDKRDKYTDNEVAAALAVAIILLLVVLAQFILAFILLRGSNNRELRKCRIWFIISAILLGLVLINFIYSLASSAEKDVYSIGSSVFQIVYKIFGLWVVYAFMEELKSSPAAAGNNPYVVQYPQPYYPQVQVQNQYGQYPTA